MKNKFWIMALLLFLTGCSRAVTPADELLKQNIDPATLTFDAQVISAGGEAYTLPLSQQAQQSVQVCLQTARQSKDTPLPSAEDCCEVRLVSGEWTLCLDLDRNILTLIHTRGEGEEALRTSSNYQLAETPDFSLFPQAPLEEDETQEVISLQEKISLADTSYLAADGLLLETTPYEGSVDPTLTACTVTLVEKGVYRVTACRLVSGASYEPLQITGVRVVEGTIIVTASALEEATGAVLVTVPEKYRRCPVWFEQGGTIFDIRDMPAEQSQ